MNKSFLKNSLIYFAIGMGLVKCSNYIKDDASKNGLKRFNSGDYSGAVGAYNKALFFDFGRDKIFPNAGDAAIYASLCGAKVQTGQYKDAIKDCDRGIAIDASLPTSYLNRCTANQKLGNYQQAIKDCQQVISLDPSNAKVHAGICQLKNVIGENKSALVACNKALEINPNSGMAYRNRCFVNGDLGNYQNTLIDCRKALDINPKDELPFLTLCRVNLMNDRYDVALNQCDIAVQYLLNNPGSNALPTAYLYRGVAYASVNKTELSCNDWKKAKELGVVDAQKLFGKYCK